MKKFITQNHKEKKIAKRSYAGHFLVGVAFFCCALLINIESFAAQNLIVKNRTELAVVENYLNNIKNLSADFLQESDNGIAQGKFLLSRPGKMRVEYQGQPQILIVVNGSVLSYKDLELDEISRLRTNTTPASLLTRKNISFDAKDVEVTDFYKNKEFTSVAVVKKNRPEAGEFRLVFKNEPFGFVRMEVKDEFGQITSIGLRNIEFPNHLDNDLFIIKNKNLP